jgi:AcrR family transcriptional regulator
MRNVTAKRTNQTRTRLKPELRRKLIVEAAFKGIAKEGFEGLRTRDIAKQVGINSATLHHHFTTKEDLITGVADHLESRLRSEKSQSAHDHLPPALAAFDNQFKDVILYQLEKPDILPSIESLSHEPHVIPIFERWSNGSITAGERASSKP